MPAIRRDPLAYLRGVVDRYGDLVAFPMPRTPVLLVNDPAGADRVLRDNHRAYGKATVQYRALSAVTGAGLLTADGDAWRGRRRLAQPAFRHGALDGVATEAVAAGEELRRIWDDAGPRTPVDADAAAMRVLLDVVGRTLFAADLAPVADRVVAAVDAALHAVVHRSASPLAARSARAPAVAVPPAAAPRRRDAGRGRRTTSSPGAGPRPPRLPPGTTCWRCCCARRTPARSPRRRCATSSSRWSSPGTRRSRRA